MNPIKKLDDWFIAQATKFSHWLQKNTSLTSYSIAKFGISLIQCTCLVFAAGYFLPYFPVKVGMGTIVSAGIGTFYALCEYQKINKAWENICQGLPSQLDETPYLFRVVICGLLAVYVLCSYIFDSTRGQLLSPSSFLGFSLFLYFREVTPLPPGKSKVKEWLEGLAISKHKLAVAPSSK
ncbi:MAG TPA: hypothetical protein VJH71_02340 [Candidatus Paceibacterota bacterium]